MLKRCSQCTREAEFSMVIVISTVGASPRRQKSSSAILFCGECMRDAFGGGQSMPGTVRDRVNDALTRLDGYPVTRSAGRIDRSSGK